MANFVDRNKPTMGIEIKKSIDMIEMLLKQLDASPSVMVESRKHSINELVEMTQRYFQA